MLDAISDFWKPSKKTDAESAIDISAMKVGAGVGFGFIPQSALSGKRATVHAINTYEFSGDRLTSYVLEQNDDTSISLIIADGEGEKYIALSRRIPFAERMRIFDNSELLACMDQADQKRLNTKAIDGEWREWVVDGYKKAIHGLKGTLIAGDFRSLTSLPESSDSKEFTYTLLVSNNNEYAIEIEQYSDNRMEVYATVYRRIADIGEITPFTPEVVPAAPAQNKSKAVAQTARELAALKPANDASKPFTSGNAPVLSAAVQDNDAPKTQVQTPSTPVLMESRPALQESSPVLASGSAETKALEIKPFSEPLIQPVDLMSTKNAPSLESNATMRPALDFAPVKAAVPTIQTLAQPSVNLPKNPAPIKQVAPNVLANPNAAPKPIAKAIFPAPAAQTTSRAAASETPAAVPAAVTQETQVKEVFIAKPIVPIHTPEAEIPSEVEEVQAPEASVQPTIVSTTKETPVMATTYNATFNGKAEAPASEARSARAISGHAIEVENDTVECELRAANRVIEEAIRNEMRMSDVVRRIIALPVAQQEMVEIPVLLTDSDYHLLAIRYGIPAADRSAIKAKIIEEINDFSGSNR